VIKNRWLAVVIAVGAVLVAQAQLAHAETRAHVGQGAGACVGPFYWWETAANLEMSASELAELPETVPVPHVPTWNYGLGPVTCHQHVR
jgi:hypothetical protein